MVPVPGSRISSFVCRTKPFDMELLCKLRLDAPRPSWPDSGKDVGIGLVPDLVKGCQEYIYI